MSQRKLIYIAVIAVCVIALIIGIVYQISNDTKKPENVIATEKPKEQETINLEEIKQNFFNLFDNSFDSQGYKVEGVSKISGIEHEDYVYAAYTIKQEVKDKYKIDINLPVFNIVGDEAAKINATTQSIFANKANDILAGTTKYTVYNIDYVAYQNDNIISLVIKSTLKEGDNPERLIVQTYNYDIVNKKQVTLNEVLQKYNITQDSVNKKIDKQVREATKQAKAVSEALGQFIYERDINNAMYVTDNVSNFFIGLDGEIFVVYPYGNSNYTSEIDIISAN